MAVYSHSGNRFFVNSRFLTQRITGVQRYAIEISTELRKIDGNIKFIAPNDIIQKDVAMDLGVENVGNFNGHIWEQISLPLHLKGRYMPLLINLANTAPLYYKNQITTIHDLSFLRFPKWFSKKFYLLYKFLIPKIALMSKKIITPSEFSKQEIMELLGIPDNAIEVIYSGVAERFKTNVDSKPPNYILAVSSLDPRKNFKNLLLAFIKLKLKDTELIIVGSKSKAFADNGIEDLVENSKNITLTGNISDEELIELYQNATLFVYPSLYEGFGLPPLESMACGCPVIVSNVTSLPEVCGNAAYYVNPYDIDDIADGIYTVLKSPTLREELRQKGLERSKLFAWKNSANKIYTLMSEVENA